MDYTTLLSEVQKRWINNERHVFVEAGPGTGKTQLIEDLLLKLDTVKHSAAVLCFNRAATESIQHRLAKRNIGGRITVSTIHSFALDTLRRYGPMTPFEPHMLDELGVRYLLLAAQTQGVLVNWEPKTVIEGKSTDPELIEFYQMLEQFGLWLPHRCVALATQYISECPFDYVLIDELQDVQMEEWLLLQKITSTKNVKCLGLGDSNQSLYTWRGAVSDVISKWALMAGVTVLTGTINRRCGQAILDATHPWIEQGQIATHAGNPVIWIDAVTAEAAATDVAAHLRDMETRTQEPWAATGLLQYRNETKTKFSEHLRQKLGVSTPKVIPFPWDVWRAQLAELTSAKEVLTWVTQQTYNPEHLLWVRALTDLAHVYYRCFADDCVIQWLTNVELLLKTAPPAIIIQHTLQEQTMHSAKGLEFRTVILTDLNKSDIQNKQLIYTAMTRATDLLILLTWSNSDKLALQKLTGWKPQQPKITTASTWQWSPRRPHSFAPQTWTHEVELGLQIHRAIAKIHYLSNRDYTALQADSNYWKSLLPGWKSDIIERLQQWQVKNHELLPQIRSGHVEEAWRYSVGTLPAKIVLDLRNHLHVYDWKTGGSDPNQLQLYSEVLAKLNVNIQANVIYL